MRTVVEDPPAERLSPEDLDALRRRFADVEGRLPDLRAHGAATLEDVAEATGLAPEAVQKHLDRIREERAKTRAVPKRRDQRALLAFAVALLGAAFVIHRLNPRLRSPEEQASDLEDRLARLNAERKAHPQVHYPILGAVRTGARPPSGYTIELKGELTTTTSGPKSDAPNPIERVALERALDDAVLNAYTAASDAEQAAPRPSTPLPKPKEEPWNYYRPPGPGELVLNLGGSIYRLPRTATPEAAREAVAFAVGRHLDSMVRGQQSSLEAQADGRFDYPTAPMGYTILYKGRESMNVGGRNQVVLPYDSGAVARKLEEAARGLVWRDARSEDDAPDLPELRAAAAKRPTPEYATGTITGPRGPVSFRLPLTASRAYPTAADAARAGGRILREACWRAAAQLATEGGP